MTEEKPKLKLYVVGQSSGDPAQWVGWTSFALVLAQNEEQAASLFDVAPIIREVQVHEPTILCDIPCYRS